MVRFFSYSIPLHSIDLYPYGDALISALYCGRLAAHVHALALSYSLTIYTCRALDMTGVGRKILLERFLQQPVIFHTSVHAMFFALKLQIPTGIKILSWVLIVSAALTGCGVFGWIESPTDAGADGGNRGFYASVGGSFSNLEPDTSDSTVFSVVDSNDSGFNTGVGRDLRSRLSAELRLGRLGAAQLSPPESVEYSFVDVSGVYYPLGDTQAVNRREGLLPFVRGGVTRMIHDSTVLLEQEDNFFIIAGLGIDYLFSSNLGVRAEFNLHDTDARAAHFGIVYRFGGRDQNYVPPGAQADDRQTAGISRDRNIPESQTRSESRPTRPPVFRPQSNAPPVTNPTQTTNDSAVIVQTPVERQPQIAPIPVQPTLLSNGVLAGVEFAQSSARLDRQAQQTLSQLASELRRNPTTRIEIQSHTDGSRSPEFAMTLARARVREIGRFLIGQGVPVTQLAARAFGDQRPLVSNPRSPLNNRTEVLVITR